MVTIKDLVNLIDDNTYISVVNIEEQITHAMLYLGKAKTFKELFIKDYGNKTIVDVSASEDIVVIYYGENALYRNK